MSDTFDHSALVAAAEGQIASESSEPSFEADAPIVPDTQTAEASNAPTEPTESVTEATIDDLEGLPAELVERFKQREANMNRDYTQKSQALAEQRSKFDALIDSGFAVEDAVNAVQFMQRLDTDTDFQADFLSRMQAHLAERGYGDTPTTDNDLDVEEDDSDYIPPSLARKLAEYDARFAQQKAQEQEMFWANKIHEQEMSLREQYGYEKKELDAIKALGFSTEGDLIKANDIYLDQQQYWAQKYLTRKTAAAQMPDVPPNTVGESYTQEPETIKDAGKNARAALEAIMASQ